MQNKLLIPFVFLSIVVLVLAFVLISITSVSVTSNMAQSILDSQKHGEANAVSNQLRTTEEIIEITLNTLDQKHISQAQTLAFMISENPELLEYEQMCMLAELFKVDEVHITDGNGVLYWGNIQDFYGFNFMDGDQTRPLLAILEDPSLTIAQEPQPRGTDGVMFQYISVSRIDQRGIVQVGVSMGRIDDIRDSMNIQSSIEGMKIGHTGGAFVIGSDKKVFADSSRALLGRDLSDQSWISEMFSGGDGYIVYEMDGTNYSAYYRMVSDSVIVTYVPLAELDGYRADALNSILPWAIAATVLIALIMILLIRWMINKIYWYESLLDSIASPITVTDVNRKWLFINKPVENMLGKKRRDIIGHPCSEWGAAICDTYNCGINCLERGQNMTTFEQFGMNFEVDVSYLTNRNGKRIGHIELVRDITEVVESRRVEADMVASIEKASTAFISASKQITKGSHALAQASMQQTVAIDELSKAVTDISEKTKSNTEMATKAANLADAIKNNAEKGSNQMEEMLRAVNEINEASGQISKVIKVIDDIAFQTNILALNAAVEAARAGQHGKGFAVVAEEVRNLAAKSAEAAKNTGSLIENSIEKANLGVQIASETSESLTMIVTGVNESNQLVGEIAKSSEDQSHAIGQLNIGIDQVSHVVQQNSATAEESASASSQMSLQANALKELIVKFDKRNQVDQLPESLPQEQEQKQLTDGY